MSGKDRAEKRTENRMNPNTHKPSGVSCRPRPWRPDYRLCLAGSFLRVLFFPRPLSEQLAQVCIVLGRNETNALPRPQEME